MEGIAQVRARLGHTCCLHFMLRSRSVPECASIWMCISEQEASLLSIGCTTSETFTAVDVAWCQLSVRHRLCNPPVSPSTGDLTAHPITHPIHDTPPHWHQSTRVPDTHEVPTHTHTHSSIPAPLQSVSDTISAAAKAAQGALASLAPEPAGADVSAAPGLDKGHMLAAARRYIDDWRRLQADEADLQEYLAPGVTFHSDGLLYGKVRGVWWDGGG